MSLRQRAIRVFPVLPVNVNGADRLLLADGLRYRTYEPDSWHRLLDLATIGSAFVDVGANHGVYSIAAARRGASAIAVEPDPQNARVIRRHARLNRVRQSVRIVEALAGEAVGTAALAKRGSAVSGSVDLYLGPTTRYSVAPVVPLDVILKDEPVTLLKIDVEGAELAVLRGTRRILERGTVVALLLEVHPPALELRGENADDLVQLLAGRGYGYEVLWDSGGPARWLATVAG